MSSLSIRLIICNYFYYKLEIKFHFFSSPFIALPNIDLIFFFFFFPHNNTNSAAYLIAKNEKAKKKKKIWYMK